MAMLSAGHRMCLDIEGEKKEGGKNDYPDVSLLCGRWITPRNKAGEDAHAAIDLKSCWAVFVVTPSCLPRPGIA